LIASGRINLPHHLAEVLSQSFAEPGRKFKHSPVSYEAEQVVGSLNHSSAVIAFTQMFLQLRSQFRFEAAVHESGNQFPDGAAANFYDQHPASTFLLSARDRSTREPTDSNPQAAHTRTDPYPVMGFIAEANVSEPLAWDGKPEICWPHLGKQELANTS
jgi:hypothetical protein